MKRSRGLVAVVEGAGGDEGRLQQGDGSPAGAALSCAGVDHGLAEGARALNYGALLRRCRRCNRVGEKRQKTKLENAKHDPVPRRAFHEGDGYGKRVIEL